MPAHRLPQRMFSTTVVLLGLTGCGDPLLGGEALDQVMGVARPPARPAWELRWLSDGPLTVDCTPLPGAEIEGEEVLLGSLFAEEPPVPSGAGPVMLAPGVSVALAALVDQGTYQRFSGNTGEPPVFIPDGEDDDDDSTDLLAQNRWVADQLDADAARGVWGVAVGRALLVVEPGYEANASVFRVGGATPAAGARWMGVVVELVNLTGRVDGALYPLEVDDEELGFDTVALNFLEEPDAELATGLAFGGSVAAETCP